MERTIERLALLEGTVLRCGREQYYIEKITDMGGSSLFYSARREGSALPVGIKECCPVTAAGSLRRENGVLTGMDGRSRLALSQAREWMLREARISQAVAAESARGVPVWDAPGEVKVGTGDGPTAPAGSFLILRQLGGVGMFLPQLLAECALPPEAGFSLRTGGRPAIHTTACIMVQILRALELVHRAGYLYGDIHPGNLFFADPRPGQGDVGFACLLDFGCARPLDGGRTAPIADGLVFTTPGYTPPELVWHNDGTLRLTPAADLYSAGRLLLYLLRGRTFFENGRDRVFTERELTRVLPAEGERLGCSAQALRQLQRLLDHSLAPEPEARYQTAAEMLADAKLLAELTRRPNVQLALGCSVLAEGEFLGREDKLNLIAAALRRGQKPVVICGFAGMGKTELAIEFARRYQRGNAYFVRFQGSVRETVTGPIADALSGYSRVDAYGREKPEGQIYREVMKLLGQFRENDLLILDNMDGGEDGFDGLRGEPSFRDLCALPMGLLVTTRSQVEGGVEADELPRPLLHQLLGRFVHLPGETADRLIGAVEGHTLTVELMGRTLKYSVPRLSPERLLEALEREELDGKALARVSTPKDRLWKKDRIQGHLTALFRLAQLPEREKRLLAYALPISPAGLEAEALAGVPEFEQDDLLRLIDRGWLRRSGEDILNLHPLVQETGWREIEVNIPAVICFAEGSICNPLGCDFEMFPDNLIARAVGYLRGVYRRTGDPWAKTQTGSRLFEILRRWGRLFDARDCAEELLEWLETQGGAEVSHWCIALENRAQIAEDLGETGKADNCREVVRQLSDAINGLFDEVGIELPGEEDCVIYEGRWYLPEDLPPEGQEMGERNRRFYAVIEEGCIEETVRLYEETRSWYQERGLNTGNLDFEMAIAYENAHDPAGEYQMLKRACAEMEHWARPAETHTNAMFTLALVCLERGFSEEGRCWMERAADSLKGLFLDEREDFLLHYGMIAVKVSRHAGWTEAEAAWREAIDELEL